MGRRGLQRASAHAGWHVRLLSGIRGCWVSEAWRHWCVRGRCEQALALLVCQRCGMQSGVEM